MPNVRGPLGIGGPQKAPLPSIRFGMEVSSAFLAITKQQRHLNAAGKHALKVLLGGWHKNIAPRHFKATARSEYKHQARSDRYKYVKATKLKAGRTDLVKTRRLQHSVLAAYRGPTYSGKFRSPGGLAGTIKMKIPWPVRDPKEPGAVTVEQMKREITTVTYNEAYKMAWEFRGHLRDELKRIMAAEGLRRRKMRGA